ncbi:MAG: UDP-N-acetylglucosamine-peptide N-acetylglucosaminyltransferase [Proteobacteria bacterium]|nr:UDP-N-acetylglucosamine-peptide N-acetylglucosaminyltransferase [Pseudomonadota bacterium]
MLQTCRALEIQGLYSQALDALNTAAATGGNLKISEQAVRLCLLTAAWQDLPRWSERYRQHCEDHLSRGGESRHAPGILNYLPDSQDLHRRAAGYYASQLSAGTEKLNPGLSAGDGRLAIGYLSADFQAHAVGFLLADVFQHHNREKFRVIAYDLSPAEGPLPERFRTHADLYRPVDKLSNLQTAQLIAHDGVQILIDLAGYTRDGRPGILTHRPAPLILSWLGYLNTLGADFVDGVIADPRLLPAAEQTAYSEQILHLPGLFTPTSRLPVASPLMSRKEAGLPADQFVFACFNNAFKIRPEDFDAWAEILRQKENSVLWLYTAGHGDLENGLRRQATKRGIDPARLIFAPWLPIDMHMARMPLADLFLDTINYNAGATAVCSLSAGVPVLTKAGDRMLSRMGASLNYSLGLESMTVSDVQTYIRSAVELARDELKLREVREKLKPSQENLNPLFSLVEFTAGYEQLLISAWEGIR